MTPEERAARRIGGSTIAKILKKSKWGTPLDAYLELTGERSPDETTSEDKDRGNFLEPALREWASKKTDTLFFKPPMQTLSDWEWATVSPDGLSNKFSNTLLEIKAPRRDDLFLWGEEGTDEVPVDALLQTHWGMMVTKADRGIVAALLGGELRIYRIARDLDLEARMLARAKEFVEYHVIPRVPPAAEYGDDKNVLFMHPRNTLPVRPWESLTPMERRTVAEYVAAWQLENASAKRLESFEPTIKEIIGDHAGITGPTDPAEFMETKLTRIDWKNDASGGTKWKSLAEELLAGMPDEEVSRLLLAHAGTPKRPLKPIVKKGKTE